MTVEGVLRMQPTTGPHAGREHIGWLFCIKVDGVLRPTRMEFRHFTGPGRPGQRIRFSR